MTSLASAEFLYVGFVLPMLFSLSLVGEGIYKIARDEEGYSTFIFGVIFLAGVVLGYMYIFSRQ